MSAMTLEMHVRGMSCGHCIGAITTAVTALPGVTGVDVDLDRGLVSVAGTPDAQAVAAAIEDSGYDVNAAQSA
jgi:copper chaperone